MLPPIGRIVCRSDREGLRVANSSSICGGPPIARPAPGGAANSTHSVQMYQDRPFCPFVPFSQTRQLTIVRKRYDIWVIGVGWVNVHAKRLPFSCRIAGVIRHALMSANSRNTEESRQAAELPGDVGLLRPRESGSRYDRQFRCRGVSPNHTRAGDSSAVCKTPAPIASEDKSFHRPRPRSRFGRVSGLRTIAG